MGATTKYRMWRPNLRDCVRGRSRSADVETTRVVEGGNVGSCQMGPVTYSTYSTLLGRRLIYVLNLIFGKFERCGSPADPGGLDLLVIHTVRQ
eukprot:572696-Pyramimonas_sp.AAC.1